MMKVRLIVFPLLMLMVLLAACVGDVSDTSDVSEEGFDFTEEEASDSSSDEGFEFSEEEAAADQVEEGFTFSEEEVDDAFDGALGGGDNNDEAGMEFDEDEAMDVSASDDPRFPPNGITTWVINYDEGSMICSSFTETIPASESDTVTILLGDEAFDFLLNGLEGGPEIYFYLIDSGLGGAQFVGYYGPPGAGFELRYDLYFLSNPNAPSANYLEGTIRAEQEGCKISRSFYGFRQD